MALTRTIVVTTEMSCCKDGQQVYNPLPKPIMAEVRADNFETSLTVWRDKAYDILYDKYSAMAEDECAGMGTLRLCNFNMSVTSVDEFGEPTKPRFIEDEEEMIEESEYEEEPPVEKYTIEGGKIKKKLRKQIAKEIAARERRINERKKIKLSDDEKRAIEEREEEYYEEAEREREERLVEAERTEVPEIVLQQLQILQNRMERTRDIDEYNSLKKEYDRLIQYYGLTE